MEEEEKKEEDDDGEDVEVSWRRKIRMSAVEDVEVRWRRRRRRRKMTRWRMWK